MCGICGFSGHSDSSVLQKMSDRIRHRGPDEEGFWSDGHMNLCSRRLNIIDPTDGKQPMCDESEQVCLVWNGEIYNHRKLRQTLESRGRYFRTNHSDTEVILRMYLEYGESFVSQLNGMFAIAIWDKRHGKLLLYRDRMGVKPLYYTLTCDASGEPQLIFASEIKALLVHPDCKRNLNDRSIYQYFSYKNCIAPETVYQDIWEVMPAQLLTFQNGKTVKQEYWNLSSFYGSEIIPCHQDETTFSHTLEEITEHLEALLLDATHLRMQTDESICSFLSGGLDSSLVSVMVGSEYPDITCFTLEQHSAIQQNYDKDADVQYARQLAESLGVQQEIFSISAEDVIKKLDKIVACFDEPFSGAVSTYMLAEAASKNFKTALTGDGADELFGGYLPHMLSFPMEYYSDIQGRFPANGAEQKLDSRRLSPMEESLDYLAAMYDFSHGDETLLSYRMSLLTDEEKQIFLGERLSHYAEEKLTLKTVQNYRAMLCGGDVLNRNLEYDSLVLLPNQVLKYTDMLSMAHSLEIRSPFMDYRIVEYVAGISGYYKMYQGETKYLLKRVAEKYLPSAIIHREKEGFVMPINDWMQKELKEYVLDTLSMDALAKQDYLRPEGVYFVLKNYYDNPAANFHLAGILWNFLCFEKWYESVRNR